MSNNGKRNGFWPEGLDRRIRVVNAEPNKNSNYFLLLQLGHEMPGCAFQKVHLAKWKDVPYISLSRIFFSV